MAQLRLDGTEVPLSPARAPLSDLEEALLKEIESRSGGLRPVEVGSIIHRLGAGCPQSGKRYAGWSGKRAIGCCPYASADGGKLLGRLARRGLIVKAGKSWIRRF